MRLQPPVYISSGIRVTQDLVAGDLHLRKNDCLFINIAALCQDQTQWQRPSEFLPERFDASSPLSLTPDCKPRNPFAFSPFLGGHRICLGKTFVEEISRKTVPILFRTFNFKLADENAALPHNNMLCQKQPRVELLISAKR